MEKLYSALLILGFILTLIYIFKRINNKNSWINLIQKKIEEIYEGESDINPYGATNKTEFFAVISEYFFERPKLLKQKHSELY